MLKKENIEFSDVPQCVTQELLVRYRLSGALKYYDNSPSKMIISLFPDKFDIKSFNKVRGYWKNRENVKKAIKNLIEQKNIPHEKIPQYISKQLLQENRLYGLLDRYNGSPINIINEIYPNEFCVTEFQRVPNRHWYKRENRITALRAYCKKHNIIRSKLPQLNRSYFQKYFPRFISVVDRHYESKFYYWIIEAFPEYTFTPEEFQLHIGIDGSYCDSNEELTIHNFLIRRLKDAEIQKGELFLSNGIENETYIPDWVVIQRDKKFIIEYFGLYQSSRFPDYTAKVQRKITFYKKLSDYTFIPIFPKDFRQKGFYKITKLLAKHGLFIKEKDDVF